MPGPDNALSSRPQSPPDRDQVEQDTIGEPAITRDSTDIPTSVLETLRSGTKTAVMRLSVTSIRALCERFLTPPPGSDWDALKKTDLLKFLHQYVSHKNMLDSAIVQALKFDSTATRSRAYG